MNIHHTQKKQHKTPSFFPTQLNSTHIKNSSSNIVVYHAFVFMNVNFLLLLLLIHEDEQQLNLLVWWIFFSRLLKKIKWTQCRICIFQMFFRELWGQSLGKILLSFFSVIGVNCFTENIRWLFWVVGKLIVWIKINGALQRFLLFAWYLSFCIFVRHYHWHCVSFFTTKNSKCK